MTNICHLCNLPIEVGQCVGHMKYKLVLIHERCLNKNQYNDTEPINFNGDTIIELKTGIIHNRDCGTSDRKCSP